MADAPDAPAEPPPSGSPFGTAAVIVNVRAGRFGKDPALLRQRLRGAGIDHVVHSTEHAGHAIDLARAAVADGHTFLVAVGGDGTIQEVVNGMMGDDGPARPGLVLGVISAGTGSDFARTFGLPRRPVQAAANLAGDRAVEVDLGRLSYTTPGGTRTRWFANIAEAGIGAEIARRALRLPRPLGRARYLVGFVLGLTAFSTVEVVLRLDGEEIRPAVTDVIVANAQYFGGGMRIAPGADPSDGIFDVLVVKGSKRAYVAAIGKLYRGRHLPSPDIDEYRASRVEVTSAEPLAVEADGEVLGTTPAVFDLAPRAIRVKV